jgi:3-oxoacyl-[acyl-carrier-protein] synthase-1
MEPATVHSEQPLRADGLTEAIRAALREAGCDMADVDFRICDISGEQYYFKEAALALSRTLRRRKEHFYIWHPADCIGEVGAAVGPALLAVILTANRKNYVYGRRTLAHMATDRGERSALVLQYICGDVS